MKIREEQRKKAGGPEAVWRIIGLAARAGKLMTGTEAAVHALRRQTASLVIVAADIAENSGQKIVRQCRQAGIPVRQFGSKSEIGHWTGHDERAVAVIQESGFAGRILELIDALDTTAGSEPAAEEKSTLGG